MSHDVFVQQIPEHVNSVGEIPPDFSPGPIGSRATIIEAIKSVCPHFELVDPSWGRVSKLPAYLIEVSLGSTDPVEGFTFHISGGQEAHQLVSAVIRKLGVRALDPTSESGMFKCMN